VAVELPWIRPTSQPALVHGEVHVWRVPLKASASSLSSFADLLSDEECARAGDYSFARERDRYTLFRGILRHLVGGYLSLDPRDLPLTCGPFGKPMIAQGNRIPSLFFNVAHSQDLGLIAVARDRPVGIDVEAVRASFDWTAIAERFFSAREFESLFALPTSQQAEAFVVLWTRKEACLKAVGSGLASGLEQVEVSTDFRRDAKLLGAPPEMLPLSRWKLHDLRPADGYRCCLVVESQDVLLKQWVWQE